jgi:hypothetical protein
MEFQVQGGGLPPGQYRAVFTGVAPFTKNVEQYGEGVELSWRVSGGTADGAIATRICGAKLTPKSSLMKFAQAFAGGPLLAGSTFSFAAHVNRGGTLLVEQTDGGGSRVSAFLPDPVPTTTTVERF